jgi:hypothetical protein
VAGEYDYWGSEGLFAALGGYVFDEPAWGRLCWSLIEPFCLVLAQARLSWMSRMASQRSLTAASYSARSTCRVTSRA